MPLKLSAAGSRSNGAIGIDLATLTLASLELKASHLRIGDGAIQVRLDSNRFDLASIGSTLPVSARYNPSGAAELHADVHASNSRRSGGGAPSGGAGDVGVYERDPQANRWRDRRGRQSERQYSLHRQRRRHRANQFDLGSGHARMQAEVGSFDPLKGNFQFNDDALKVAEIVPSENPGRPKSCVNYRWPEPWAER